jgi:peptidoglycan/LPS O-acetylase OafA/YrhL
MEETNRIKILDGFRTIAALSVILFHYYSRWTTPCEVFNLYPYNNKYSFFNYGYLGVQFFFIISGFVIAFTLYKTDNIKTFWKKRIARLFPAMLLCSVITFIAMRSFDTKNLFPTAHSIRNFLPALSFISPYLWNYCLRFLHLDYFAGCYWSLWPEIQFYCMASIIYYIRPSKFFQNFTIAAFLVCLLNFIMIRIHCGSWSNRYNFWLVYVFSIPAYIGWFAAGVLFYAIYSKKAGKLTIGISSITVLLQLYNCVDKEALVMLICIAFFLIFIFSPRTLNFLAYKPIANIGMASYSLYLIHENIGVLLICKYAGYWGRFDFLFPLLVIAIMITFSLLSYRFFEKPVSKLLSRNKAKD